MYAMGQGVSRDYVQAHMWLSLAASPFSEKDDRERAIKVRNLIAAKMTPQQIAEAQALATNWKPKGE
jgi:hypothetical protein